MPGHSTAAASNALYRKNLGKGQTGLSVAFDLPTQTGYDSDHPLAKGEVGKVGVPISHLGDMRTLFDGIPLGEMNTSMTINATAAWLLALYVALADEQGVRAQKLQGTTQNDIIKEYLSRGTYVFPPAPSMRLTKDVILFTTKEMPKWNPMNVCSYHLQEAGATPVQELAFALATAIGVLDAVKASGQCAPEANSARWSGASRSSSMPACASSPKSARCAPSPNCGTRSRASATASPTPSSGCSATACRSTRSGLTEQQPENNVSRILLEMLAVTLSKDARARAVQLPAWNEALGLPRPWDQQWSLRMQQILAYETDLLEYGDIFDGSPVIAAKVAELKAAAKDETGSRSKRWAAPSPRSNPGYMKQQLVESNSRRVEAIERGEQIVVGVNRFVETEPSPLADAADAVLTVVGRGRDRTDRAARTPGAPRATPRRSPRRSTLCARRRKDGAQHHAGLDRLRQSRRHHRRMGLCAARGVRRIPRADRRRHRHAQRRRRPRRHPRRGRPRVEKARPALEISGRQARPRRPFQRRRADRRARPRRRHGRGL